MNCHYFGMFNVRRSLLSYRIHSIILIFAAILSHSMVWGTNSEESNCDCSEDITIIKKSVAATDDQIKKWIPLYNFVYKLMDEWQEEMLKKLVHEEMENYAETKLNDLIQTHKISEKVHQLTNTLDKVEKVENYTKEVEEELRSEVQARKNLETRIQSIDNQLKSSLIGLNASISEMNLQVFSSIQNINKTIYDKVDGKVYRNETRKLEKQILHMQTEIQDACNSSTFLKLVDNVENLDKSQQFINNKINDDLVPRIMMLDAEAVRKVEVEGLKNKMTDVLNNTAKFQNDLSDVSTVIQDIKNLIRDGNATMEMVKKNLTNVRKDQRKFETRIQSIDHQLKSSLIQLNASINEMNLQVFSSIQNINKTIYDKVDGAEYKKETRKLKEQIKDIQTEIQDGFNSSTILKLIENVKNLDENLQFINNTTSKYLVPRIMMLDSEAVRKSEVEDLENKMTYLLNNSTGFQKDLSDVGADIQDIKSFHKVQENITLECITSVDDLRIQMLDLKNKTYVPYKLPEEVDTTAWNNEDFITSTTTMVTNREVSTSIVPACVDVHPHLSNCAYVVKTRKCKLKIYKRKCCASCMKAGLL